ncbi:MAG: energy-coupling factor ABC transporter permease [Nitrospiraceae bacterium]|nr:energy-coupling factor ABC transporter permease [Nitrospiraceae bacterium]
MSDALISPAVGTTFWAGTIAVIGYCSRKLKEKIDDKLIPLMGVMGAFIFAAQMINFTIPGTGSSGHLGGGMILAAMLGSCPAFIVMASVLVVQALFFADGGLVALGCNIWNLGVYPCFIAYPLIYRPLVKDASSAKRIVFASVVGAVIALQLGAFSVVIQTLLSGQSELPFGSFVLAMQPIHLAIGIIEGIITAGVINFVRTARPEIIKNVILQQQLSPNISIKKIIVILGIAALLTGGIFSWFASSHPDGLEWSIKKVFGKPELADKDSSVHSAAKSVQEKTAVMPDYDFKKSDSLSESEQPGNSGADEGKSKWPAVRTGTSIAGIIGSLFVVTVVVAFGFLIRLIRKKQAESRNV